MINDQLIALLDDVSKDQREILDEAIPARRKKLLEERMKSNMATLREFGSVIYSEKLGLYTMFLNEQSEAEIYVTFKEAQWVRKENVLATIFVQIGKVLQVEPISLHEIKLICSDFDSAELVAEILIKMYSVFDVINIVGPIGNSPR